MKNFTNSSTIKYQQTEDFITFCDGTHCQIVNIIFSDKDENTKMINNKEKSYDLILPRL